MPSVNLRELYRFEARAKDANGVRAGPGWVLVTTEPTGLTNLTGGEEVTSNRLEGKQPVLLVVRYHRLSAQIDSSCRAIDARTLIQGGSGDGFVYDLKSVTPRPRHDFIDILAIRRLAGTPA